MSVAFNGFNEKTLTFKASGTIAKGAPVNMTSNATVVQTSAGGDFIGIAGKVRNGYVEVKLNGYTKSTYSGTAPSVGKTMLGANGSGGVKVVASGGTNYLVLNVNTSDSTVEYLI